MVSVAVIALAFVVTLGAADLGRVLVARSKARTAADSAALAAVQELALPTGLAPDQVAADYATRNGASLDACTCEPGSLEVLVQVSIVVDGFLLVPGARSVHARARAIVSIPPSSAAGSPGGASPAAGSLVADLTGPEGLGYSAESQMDRISDGPTAWKAAVMRLSTSLRKKGQVTIPREIREAAHLEEGDPLQVEITTEGILLRPQKIIDATQAWFWTPSWQAGEAAASADIEAGRVSRSASGEDLLASLDD